MTQDIASINDIVNQLYDAGKICLTAYAGAGMDKKYRHDFIKRGGSGRPLLF